MATIQKFIAALVFSTIVLMAAGQQKFALLVGINNYYKNPGQLYTTLHGCDNDIHAVKALLINRFGFSEQGITTIFDEQATKESVTLSLLKIATKCKAGDAVVFYFSGHGVWFYDDGFGTNIADSVNGAMVMSDLYAPNNDFLLTSNTLIKIFNILVDKKVKVTCFYDCCYSGNIVKQFYSGVPVEARSGFTDFVQTVRRKSLSLSEILTATATDASNTMSASIMKLREDHNSTNRLLKDSSLHLLKAYDLKDNIYDNKWMPHVSNNSNTMFLSFAATNGQQKGLEIMDETGNYHGVLTKALLTVMKESPADLPAFSIFNKMKEEINKQGFSADQTPMYSCESKDPVRLKGNLVGVNPRGFSNTITVKCGAAKGNYIPVYAGTDDGLAKGNLLTDEANKSITIHIISADNQWSVGEIQSGDAMLIKEDDSFMLTDGYTISDPLIKICIPERQMTEAGFDSFFKAKIIPLTQFNNYRDGENIDRMHPSQNIFFNDTATHPDSIALAFITNQRGGSFFTFLPIPSYIAATIKDPLSKNQNIQLVASPAEADHTLYLNYIKGDKSFVFTYLNLKGTDTNKAGFGFYNGSAKTANLFAGGTQMQVLNSSIYEMTIPLIRRVSDHWMNEYLLR